MKFSLQAGMFVNGKEVQGNLNIDSKGFAFISNGKRIFSKSCNWEKLISNRVIEKRSKLLFLKVERIYYTLSFDNYVTDKIYINSGDEHKFNNILKIVKEFSAQEAERKRIEELARQEAERKCQEELARQEAEQKSQEKLARREAERKFQEELAYIEKIKKQRGLNAAREKLYATLLQISVFKKMEEENCIRAQKSLTIVFKELLKLKLEELARQEAERKHQEELARQEAERKRQEELARQEAERKRQEELARQEAERKRQEELACQEAERKRQEELARQEEERKHQEVERKRQEVEHKCHERKAYEVKLLNTISPDYLYIVNEANNAVRGNVDPFTTIIANHLIDNMELLFNDNESSFEEKYQCIVDDLTYIMIQHNIPDAFIKEFIHYFEVAYCNRTINIEVLLQFVLRLLEFKSYKENVHDSLYHEFDYGVNFVNFFKNYSHETAQDNQEYSSDQDWKKLMREVANEQRESTRQNRIKEEAVRIHDYILMQRRPITRGHLRKTFRYYSGNLMDKLLTKGDILDLRGEFLALKNVSITEVEKEHMYQDIVEILDDNDKVCHCSEVYDELIYSYNSVFRNSYITDGRKLFGLIQGLYRNELMFDYPYIAMDVSRIPSPKQRIKMLIGDNEVVSVDELTDFIRAKHLKINSFLEFIISMNDFVLLKNREEIMQIKLLPITKHMIYEIEELIIEELEEDDFKAIRDLKCIVKFPALTVPWDEWLIYTSLAKWGERLYLHTTVPRFKYAIPVISRYSYIDSEDLEDIADRYSGQISLTSTHTLDDMDSLDDLIADDIDLDDIDLDDLVLDDIDLDDFDMDDIDLEDI